MQIVFNNIKTSNANRKLYQLVGIPGGPHHDIIIIPLKFLSIKCMELLNSKNFGIKILNKLALLAFFRAKII